MSWQKPKSKFQRAVLYALLSLIAVFVSISIYQRGSTPFLNSVNINIEHIIVQFLITLYLLLCLAPFFRRSWQAWWYSAYLFFYTFFAVLSVFLGYLHFSNFVFIQIFGHGEGLEMFGLFNDLINLWLYIGGILAMHLFVIGLFMIYEAGQRNTYKKLGNVHS